MELKEKEKWYVDEVKTVKARVGTVVGTCCIRLHNTANRDATNPNVIGPKMLGVVAPVCMHIALRIRQNNHLELIGILMTAVIQTM